MPTTHRFSIHAQLRYRLAQDGWLLLNIAPVERPSQKVVHENIRNNRGIPFRDLSAPKGTTRLHGIAVPAGNL